MPKDYQILPDIFAHTKDDDPIIQRAKTALLNNNELRNEIFKSVKTMLDGQGNLPKKSLDGLQLDFERYTQQPSGEISPRTLAKLKPSHSSEHSFQLN